MTPERFRSITRRYSKLRIAVVGDFCLDRYLEAFLIALFLCAAAHAANYPLKISSTNPRILVELDNVPFLVTGDSPHALFSNLSSPDAAAYLADRAARGIKSMWVKLLCIRPVEGRPDASLLPLLRSTVRR